MTEAIAYAIVMGAFVVAILAVTIAEEVLRLTRGER